MSLEDLATQIAATAFGVVLGFPIALLVDRQLAKQRSKNEAIVVIDFLIRNLSRNVSILKDIQQFLPQFGVFYYVNLKGPNSEAFSSFEKNVNSQLVSEVSTIEVEFQLQSRKIDALYKKDFSVGSGYGKAYVEWRQGFVEDILNNNQILIGKSTDLINSLMSESKKLKEQRKTLKFKRH